MGAGAVRPHGRCRRGARPLARRGPGRAALGPAPGRRLGKPLTPADGSRAPLRRNNAVGQRRWGATVPTGRARGTVAARPGPSARVPAALPGAPSAPFMRVTPGVAARNTGRGDCPSSRGTPGPGGRPSGAGLPRTTARTSRTPRPDSATGPPTPKVTPRRRRGLLHAAGADQARHALEKGLDAGWEFRRQVRPSPGLPDEKKSYRPARPHMAGLWPDEDELAWSRTTSPALAAQPPVRAPAPARRSRPTRRAGSRAGTEAGERAPGVRVSPSPLPRGRRRVAVVRARRRPAPGPSSRWTRPSPRPSRDRPACRRPAAPSAAWTGRCR